MATVGVVGLGIMGSAMAQHLLAGGYAVAGYDVQAGRMEQLAGAGGSAAASAGAVADGADVVITSLPSADAAVEVCTALAVRALRGLVVVETSTLPHEAKERCRQLLHDAGAELLDCPLSGTGAQALERDVVVYGSGEETAFERVRPVLESFSRSVRYLGPFGRGSTMKLVANLLVAVHNASTAEAFALGEAAGLDSQQIYDTIRDGAGNSVIFEKRGRLMVDRAYLPATAKISMFVKDVGLIVDYAERLGLSTPMLDATRPLYDRAVDSGFAEADAAVLREVIGTRAQPPAQEGQE
jgi:putative dehydrogenase